MALAHVLEAPAVPNRRVILGHYAPPPPARSGVVEYAAALHAALARHCDIRPWPEQASARLYHLGNNPLHLPVWRRFMDAPGAVLLHDATLHHFYLGTHSRDDYIEAFCAEYGEWRRGEAESLWTRRAVSTTDPVYYHLGMLGGAAKLATAVIVHNSEAALRARLAGAGSVFEIPHLCPAVPHITPADRAAFRTSIGVGSDKVLFGILGHLRWSKRIVPALRAWPTVPNSRLLVAGDAPQDVEAALADTGVIRLGYLTEQDLWRAIAALDVCLNLRYPSAGETSGIAMRAAVLGVPLVVTAGNEWTGWPEDALFRVDPPPAEQQMLADAMATLAAHPELRALMAEQACRHVTACHGSDVVARRLLDILTTGCAI